MSPLDRFGTGLKDPIEGGAQLLTHVLPDAIVKPVNQFNNWLADKTGLVEKLPPGGMDEEAEQREKTIQAQTPKGIDWWRIAGDVASPANYAGPASVLGDANMARRIGSAAIQGATTGMMQPVASQGSFAEKKAEQAIAGTVTGGAVGAIAEPVAHLARWVTGVHGQDAVNDKAVQQVLARVQSDQKGGGASFQDMLDLANATPGKPMAFADVADENAKGLLGKIARAPGDAKAHIAKFFRDRDIDTGTRVSTDISNELGGGARYYVDQALQDARSKAAKPLYEKAFANHKPLDSTYLEELLDTNPRIQQGMKKGWAIERDEAQGEGRPLDATSYGITSIDPDGTINLGQVPNLKLWNVVKKGLDAQIEAAKDPLTGRLTQEGVAISKLKNGVLRELDRLSPDYRAAREAWGGPTVSMAAMRQGQNIFKMEPEEIEDSFRKMTGNEREFFKLGAANTMRKMVQKTGEKGDEVRQLMLPYAKRQMRAMFPDDASFERFFASLNAEHKMWQAWASTYAGSNSADKLAEDMRADTTAASHGVRGLHAATEGRWLPAIGHGLQAVGRYLKPEDPRLSMAKAKLYTAPPADTIAKLQAATKGMPTIRIYPNAVPGVAAATTPDQKSAP
jgi:hypothetical protein